MKSGLTVRPPREEDVSSILDLFRESFRKPISPEHYHWKLRTRQTPVENTVIALEPGGRVVFHSAGIPCRALVAGAERWVMLGCDVMTAPAYRRRGLNSRYSAEMYQRWKEAGVSLVIGFTNQTWGASSRNVGLIPLGPLATLAMPLRPERILARKVGIPSLGKLDLVGPAWRRAFLGAARGDLAVSRAGAADESFDDLWNRVRPAVGNTLVRDRAWVAWRYLASPDVIYRVLAARRGNELAGYAAWSAPDARAARLVEVFTAPGDREVFDSLVRACVEEALRGGADVIRTLAAPGSWPHEALRKNGFVPERAGVVEHIPLDPSLSPAEIGQSGDWYLSAGDFDAF